MDMMKKCFRRIICPELRTEEKWIFLPLPSSPAKHGKYFKRKVVVECAAEHETGNKKTNYPFIYRFWLRTIGPFATGEGRRSLPSLVVDSGCQEITAERRISHEMNWSGGGVKHNGAESELIVGMEIP